MSQKVRTFRETVVRRVRQAVLGLGVLALLICAATVVTAAVDDYAIAKDHGMATAEVTDVGTLRTTVRYRDSSGHYHQPSTGLGYPMGLVEGQQVRVEYQVGRPENVKVEGRGWTLAIIPAMSAMLVVLVVLALLLWVVRRWERRLLGSPTSVE